MNDAEKQIVFYSTDYTKSLPVSPGNRNRSWIRKLQNAPLNNDLTFNMAAESGWVFQSPGIFTIEWNGGSKPSDTVVHSNIDISHLFFTGVGDGVCSIKTGYVVKTPEDYAIYVTGAPNFYKENAFQLTSLIETNWTHVTFMLHWKLMTPGKVTFQKNEPLGFVTIVPHKQLSNFELVTDTILINPELYDRYMKWQTSDPEVDYYREGIEDCESMQKTDKFHITDRRLTLTDQQLQLPLEDQHAR